MHLQYARADKVNAAKDASNVLHSHIDRQTDRHQKQNEHVNIQVT